MTSGKRRLTGALVVVAALLSGPAFGATPTDVATARELYQAGAAALDGGDAKLAVEKLSQAWALVQTPIIGADLARAERQLGHLIEAREAALAVQRLPRAADETARSAQARADADKIAADVVALIPHVRVVVTGVGEHHTATVTLDGTAIPVAALGVARQANPGEHKATLDTDDGRHVEGAVTLAEGETKDLKLDAPPAPAAAAPPPTIAPAPPAAATPLPASPSPTPPPNSSTRSPLVWIGGVVGGAGLVAGGITGAMALNEASVVSSHCHGAGSDGKTVCLPPYTTDLSHANTYATISTIGLVVAGVGAGLLVTGLLIGGHGAESAASARITPMLGPVSGVAGVF